MTASGPPAPLPSQRALFEIPDEVAYLNCAYMSPQPRAVREAGQAAAARKSSPWRIAPADFFTEAELARALFAELVGGDADGVAIVPSVSYGVAVAAANVAAGPGRGIVVLAEQFPSNVLPWRELARRREAPLVTVARPADGDWTTALLARIDAGTGVVAVPHAHWTDGGLVDLVRVGERARAVGAALVVDATQSLGAVPLDVAAVRPDFLVAACYKWLLGPYAVGFLHVAPERRGGEPIEHNWIARAGSEDFTGLVEYRDDFQPGARRFDVGERSNFSLLPPAIAGLRQLLAWGVPSIELTIRALTDRIERGARQLGLEATPGALRGGHMLGVRFPDGAPKDLAARLAAANVHVSVRGDALRVSPHVYNTAAEADRLLAVLAGGSG